MAATEASPPQGGLPEETAGAESQGSAPVFPVAAPRRVVFDTNVLVSLYVFADSRFAPLRSKIESGAWLALTNDACFGEFRRVLAYPMFKLWPRNGSRRRLAAYDACVTRHMAPAAAAKSAVAAALQGPRRPEVPRTGARRRRRLAGLRRQGACCAWPGATACAACSASSTRMRHCAKSAPAGAPEEGLRAVSSGYRPPLRAGPCLTGKALRAPSKKKRAPQGRPSVPSEGEDSGGSPHLAAGAGRLLSRGRPIRRGR
jgi:hypothetical protein